MASHDHYMRLQQQHLLRMQQQQQMQYNRQMQGQQRMQHPNFPMFPRQGGGGGLLSPQQGMAPQQHMLMQQHMRTMQQQQQRGQPLQGIQNQFMNRTVSAVQTHQQQQQQQQGFTASKSGKKIIPWEVPHSKELPTKEERNSTHVLRQYIDEVAPLETDEQTERRDQVIKSLEDIFKQWVKDVAIEKEAFPSMDALDDAGKGKLYISGSYRLNVNSPGADIDCVCVAPRYCTREDFFRILPEKLRENPQVDNILPIPTAKVPIIGLELDGIQIDLLLASVDQHEVTDDFDILDDQVLRNVDDATVKSLNGPRVTELLTKLVPNYETFKLVLRVVRYWAKKRGIFSNKMGYLGGVNLAIMAAYVCQLYPGLSAAGVLFRFFHVFSERNWSQQPVLLCTPYEDPQLQLEIWDPRKPYKHARDVMPVITPAYPCANSTYNVSRSTLAVMQREFFRGRYITNAILKHHLSRNSNPKSIDWKPLFYPVEFFTEFDWYLALDAWVDPQYPKEDYERWKGYIEARIRKLVEHIEREHLPIEFIYNFPDGFEEEEDVEIEEEIPQDEEGNGNDEETPQEDAEQEIGDDGNSIAEGETTMGNSQEHTTDDNNEKNNADKSSQEEITTAEDAAKDENVTAVIKRKVNVKQRTISFFIAFAPDMHSVRGKTLDLRKPIRGFKDNVIKLFGNQYHEGMHLRERVLKWKDLPNTVFSPLSRETATLLRRAIKAHQRENGKSWKLLKGRKALNTSLTWKRSAAAEDKKYDRALDLSELILSTNVNNMARSHIGGPGGEGAGGLQLPGLSSSATPGLSLTLGARSKRYREESTKNFSEKKEEDGINSSENTQTKLIRKSKSDRSSRSSGISNLLHHKLREARWDDTANMNEAAVPSDNMEQDFDQIDSSQSFETKLLPEQG